MTKGKAKPKGSAKPEVRREPTVAEWGEGWLLEWCAEGDEDQRQQRRHFAEIWRNVDLSGVIRGWIVDPFIDIDRERHIADVNHELRLFARLQNGHALWRAYALCRERGEVPEVILRQLDDIGDRLAAANTAEEISAAVHLQGRGNVGSARRQLAQVDESVRIVSLIEQFKSLYSLSDRKAQFLAARDLRMTFEAVRKAHGRWKRKGILKKPMTRRPASSVFEWGQGS